MAVARAVVVYHSFAARVLFDPGRFTRTALPGCWYAATDPRVRRPAARAGVASAEHGSVAVRVHRRAGLSTALLALLDAPLCCPLVSPPFASAIAMIFSFRPRAHHLRAAGPQGVTVCGVTEHARLEILTYSHHLLCAAAASPASIRTSRMALSLGASRWRVRTVTAAGDPRSRERIPAVRVARRLKRR